jgi:hypothetical protein
MKKGKRVFSTHTVDEHVDQLHRTGFEITSMKFTRFDEKD